MNISFIFPLLVLQIIILLLNQPTQVLGACLETKIVIIQPKSWHYVLNQNQALQGHVINTTTSRNTLQCAATCRKHDDCKSFNYSPRVRTCELNSGTRTSNSDDFETRHGYEYHEYMYAWLKESDCSFTTPAWFCYQFLFPRLPEGTTKIDFSVKVHRDAFVGLTTQNGLTTPFYEIVFGGSSGTKIVIRRGKASHGKASFNIGDVTSNTEYRRFWISFAKGLIQVGRHGESAALAEWQDPDPIPVHHVGFCSWPPGSWKFHTFC